MFIYHNAMKNEKGLLSQIFQGINDMCYIWWLEVKNTFKDEGMLIFFILVHDLEITIIIF